MNLTDEQLKQIESYASDLMTWREIAILMDIPAEVLREDFLTDNSPASRAYNKGKTKTILALRSSVVQNAKRGSPQSEVLVLDLINNQKINETDIL